MTEITKKAWEVFRSAFKDGELVVIEGPLGGFYWGKLKATKDSVQLTRPNGHCKELAWEHIEFMAHGGFPVRQIMRMSYQEAAALAARTPTEIIRRALEGKMVGGEKDYWGHACPFEAGPGQLIAIHNRGNCGPAYWKRDDAEVLVFRADDGAIMHSYDTDHLFLDF